MSEARSRKASWLVWVATIAGICLALGLAVQVGLYRRTEAPMQRAMLRTVKSVEPRDIESIRIYWRWGRPAREVVLSSERDWPYIQRVHRVLTTDLWVSNAEEGEPLAYDLILITLKNGRKIPVNCWLGKATNGETKASLTLRSRSGAFKDTMQQVLRAKGADRASG